MRDVKKKLLLITCLLLTACLPEANKQIDIDNVQIIQGALGTQKYYIPELYFGSRSKDFSDGTIMLDFQYPNFLPLNETTQEMWNKG